MDAQIFPIVPAPAKTIWFTLATSLIPIVLSLLLVWLAFSGRRVQFAVSQAGVRISGDFYGRTVPAAALAPEKAQLVDFSQQRGFAPKWRTNGAALPGYRSGWFRLRNGEKALLFVTATDRVVYLPTNDGYSLVVSPENPEMFLQAVQRLRTVRR